MMLTSDRHAWHFVKAIQRRQTLTLPRVNFATGMQVFDLESTKDLALSPVVIATYEEMARALGWPNTYEDPYCQETDYPSERIFQFFPQGFRLSIVRLWHRVRSLFPWAGAPMRLHQTLIEGLPPLP
jgi:hypothetical protein